MTLSKEHRVSCRHFCYLLLLSDWCVAVPEMVPKSVLGYWLERRVVIILRASRVNSSSWQVKGPTIPLICSLTASCVNVRISETSLSTFSDEFPVAFSLILPFPFSIIVRSIDVLRRLPFLSSLYSSELSIQVSRLEYKDEFGCDLVVYKGQYSGKLTKVARRWKF